MLTARILPQHRRCHKTTATPHIHDRPPTSPLADRSDILSHHRCGLRAGAEEHPEDVDVHEALEFGDGGAIDGSWVAYTDLSRKEVGQLPGISMIR